MNSDSTIQLPPPRQPGRGRVPDGVWVLWIVAALVGGLAAGIFVGKELVPVRSVVVRAPGDPTGPMTPPPAPPKTSPETLAEAEKAVAEGDWLKARGLFQDLVKANPDDAAANTALMLVDRHLTSARAVVRIETSPPGAKVRLGTLGEAVTPAEFTDVPYGKYHAEISLEGYQALDRDIAVNQPSVDIHGIDLSRSTGVLKLSSVPEGVEFKILRTDNLKELVKIGKTPAEIEKLDSGEYQVLMALKGWPDYSEKVKVESNRHSSVSHIFAKGGLKITSDPAEAEIWLTADASLPARRLGVTPLNASDLPVGRHRIEARYRDWPAIQRTVEVREGEALDLDFAWQRGTVAFSSNPPGAMILRNDQPALGGDARQATAPYSAEFPEGVYTFVAQVDGLDPVIREIEVKADSTTEARFDFAYGSVSINSQPPGATVLLEGKPIGRTPFRREVVRPGQHTFGLAMPSHQSTTVSGEVKPGQGLNFDTTLIFDPTPKTQADFVNGLGQKMVWIGALRGWVAAHEVTNQTYTAVMRKPATEGGDTTPNLPAVGMKWIEATRFCDLLTTSEGGAGRLPKGFRYTLPSDQMWSAFVGNAGLEIAVTSSGVRREGPAPVGSLGPNEFGLFDTRGNVWEWCEDWYSLDIVNRARNAGTSTNESWAGTDRKVLRGGSWNRSSASDLHREFRYAMPPSTAGNHEIGFRVVLMPE